MKIRNGVLTYEYTEPFQLLLNAVEVNNNFKITDYITSSNANI